MAANLTVAANKRVRGEILALLYSVQPVVTSPAWRLTRKTCSPCWASPAMRTAGRSWRQSWPSEAFCAGVVNAYCEQRLNLLFCIVFYEILCYAEHRITIPPAILFDRSDYYGQTDYGREGFR